MNLQIKFYNDYGIGFRYGVFDDINETWIYHFDGTPQWITFPTFPFGSQSEAIAIVKKLNEYYAKE
jgi:hypothetical protein